MGPHQIPETAGPPRLQSLDALRGFDMFWIAAGGGTLVKALAAWCPWPGLTWLAGQLEHPEWDGFTFYDLIFPLFLFISGVTMPLSLTRRREAGVPLGALYWRITRRAALLVFLGLVCNGLLKFDFANLRYPSVLGRIGIAYFFAALIVLHAGRRGQFLWAAGLLLGYFAAMKLIPVPGVGAGALTMEGNLASYIDRTILPGRLYRGIHDPEGLLSTVPAVSTALLGALTGSWLVHPRGSGLVKAVGLIAAGLVGLALGGLWNIWFPINKNLWSSSFVLWTAGWSWLFLAVFYLLIDVWGLRRWAFFFIVIGMNSITIFMVGNRIISFNYTAHYLFDGMLRFVSDAARPALFALGVVLLEWLFLYFLYRQRIFLRV